MTPVRRLVRVSRARITRLRGKDAYGAARDTREVHGGATAESELLIAGSLRHGTDILGDGGPPAEQVRAAMTSFVQRVSAADTTY